MQKYWCSPNTPLNWIPSKHGSNSCENVFAKKPTRPVYNSAREYTVFWMSTRTTITRILSMMPSSRSKEGTIVVDFEGWVIWLSDILVYGYTD